MLELARFESGARFEDGKNYLFISPWAPPYPYMRRTRPRIPTCDFCGRTTTREVLAEVWPELRTEP